MERALLVSVHLTDRTYRDSWPIERSAQELRELVSSSGVKVAQQVLVNRERPTVALLIGTGKAQEIHDLCHNLQVDVVVFDQNLTFPQQRNLEEILDVKVIDRTQLILDIFAQRAHSQEGKVQVELAQLEYLLPRLAGKGVILSRLGGGIGTRGPGEQKLEVDRRRIRLKIGRLRRELQEIHARRGVSRQKRQAQEIPTIALVGYTNVGKSSLLNALTHVGAVAENRLFTTLDPLARRLILPNHQPILLTDTVGFLHRLPHHLVEAFQATLEEVTHSQILLHVLDASHSMLEEQSQAVYEVLKQLDADEKPMVVALNKIDRITPQDLRGLLRQHPQAVPISALTGEGMDLLLERIMNSFRDLMKEARIRLPRKDQRWLKAIYEQGQVLKRRDLSSGILLITRLPHRLYGQLLKAGLLADSS